MIVPECQLTTLLSLCSARKKAEKMVDEAVTFRYAHQIEPPMPSTFADSDAEHSTSLHFSVFFAA
jgi:hypothetical protein